MASVPVTGFLKEKWVSRFWTQIDIYYLTRNIKKLFGYGPGDDKGLQGLNLQIRRTDTGFVTNNKNKMGDAETDSDVQWDYDQHAAYPESLEGLQQVYKKWASTYDQDMVDCSDISNESMAEASLEYIENKGSTLMLDVGAGTGRTAQFYKAAGWQISIYRTRSSLEVTLPNIVESSKIYLHALTANRSLPVDDNTYDVVTAAAALMVNHLDPECIRTMLDAVKPGGLLIYISRTSSGNEAYLRSLTEVGDGLEKEGKMELLKMEEIPYHKTEITALIFVYKKL